MRGGLETVERWLGSDKGVIAAWERGRVFAQEVPDLAARARRGELVILPWKGGLERALKSGQKFGTKRYLAMWQGMRGDALDVDLVKDESLVCAATGVTVVFTSDLSKYGGEDADKSQAGLQRNGDDDLTTDRRG
jgi:hypothetical protein